MAVRMVEMATKQAIAPSRLRYATRLRIERWLLVLPALLLILGLGIYPLLSSLALSFQRWDLQSQDHPFVGLANYRDALIDPRVWHAFGNTGILVVGSVALEFLLGLGLALLFVGDFRGKKLAMPLLMLPVMVVPVVVGLTWRMLWDNQYGPINQTLSWIVGHDVNIIWLAHRDTALFAMIVTDVWQWTPFMFLILLAALSSVNPELYEAASLDGAGWWQSLRDISLPGIARVVAVVILFRALDAFKIFDLVFMFTQGGPGTSTETISWYIYQLGFTFFRLGYASAVSYIAVILLSIIATLYVARFLRSSDE
jgi:multiple sugar transport system permease protein